MPIPIIEQAFSHGKNPAIFEKGIKERIEKGIDGAIIHSYQDLLEVSKRIAQKLLQSEKDLAEARVAYLVTSGFSHVAVQWGIWRAGGIAIPLHPKYPLSEWFYVLEDTQASILVYEEIFWDKIQSLDKIEGLTFLSTKELILAKGSFSPLPDVMPHRRSLILYTSGTTGKPKGVVHTHKSLSNQVKTLVKAWSWSSQDIIIHVLPLHHIHGIVNVLMCSLWVGAQCQMYPRFEPSLIWKSLQKKETTLFMAVPTIYQKLIQFWKNSSLENQKRMSKEASQLRLMVSGSAALPIDLYQTWQQITGHFLLERYGMTEIGMALSNTLEKREPGHVGSPLPGVRLRLTDVVGAKVSQGEAGEIEIQGENLFLEYWQRPQETESAFRDQWFRTGDIAVEEPEGFRILGRNSVDIIKTGGYKVSALEIENTLRLHPLIEDCAVIGTSDEEWGERVCAALVLIEDKALTLDSLREWGKDKLAPHKLPRQVQVLTELPKNVLGKVTKKELRSIFV